MLDSNILIAAFATRGLCSDIYELCLSEHKVILSHPIIQEVHANLVKKLKLKPSVADSIRKYLASAAEVVNPSHVPQNSCRDKSDLVILGTAVAGEADIIISGDNDLLTLNEFRSILILSPRQFWNTMQKRT